MQKKGTKPKMKNKIRKEEEKKEGEKKKGVKTKSKRIEETQQKVIEV